MRRCPRPGRPVELPLLVSWLPALRPSILLSFSAMSGPCSLVASYRQPSLPHLSQAHKTLGNSARHSGRDGLAVTAGRGGGGGRPAVPEACPMVACQADAFAKAAAFAYADAFTEAVTFAEVRDQPGESDAD